MKVWSGNNVDFVEGQLILIDKPYHWSSFDVVKKLRWQIRQKLEIKKIKVGHAGTLDPLATGLLILATGKMTKSIDQLMGMEKVYTGTIQLGGTTPSYDLETKIDEEFPTDHISKEDLQTAVLKLTGKIDQIPPIFSAKKVNGRRAYTLAREGKPVELKSREVEIKSFEIQTDDFPQIHFRITCSKGTYIRSMARDFGLELNSGGHLIALRRELTGEYSVENSYTPESFIEALEKVEKTFD